MQERFAHWLSAVQKRDALAETLRREHPLKEPKSLPKVMGMTAQTRKFFRLKALKYLLAHDKGLQLMRHILKAPLKHAVGYINSLIKTLLRGSSFRRDDDFFYYGIRDDREFVELLNDENCRLLLGFSYCHKPHECPSGRFTDQCARLEGHPVCGQCFIYQMIQSTHDVDRKDAQRIDVEIIPTVHAIGHAVFKIQQAHPTSQLLFLITACEMTLEMFGDWGNMAGIRGIGVRLDGRICNTLRAFELSEKGIKPGLTTVLPRTQRRMLQLIGRRYL